jgi:hypothetical protein
MDLKDYYELLGVASNAEKKIIQLVFRLLEAKLTAQAACQQLRLAHYREIYYEATWIEIEIQE